MDEGAAEGVSDPAAPARLLDRATELADRGDYAQSLALAERVIALSPDDAAAHVARAWAFENLGDDRLADAREAYRTALSVDPGSLWAIAGLATVAERLGDPEEASRLFRRVADTAVPDDQDDPEVLEIVGWSCFKAGRAGDAQSLFRRALAADPSLMAVHLDLALAMLFSGEAGDAVREYRAALRSEDVHAVRAHAAVALEDLLRSIGDDPARGPQGATAAADLLRSAANAA